MRPCLYSLSVVIVGLIFSVTCSLSQASLACLGLFPQQKLPPLSFPALIQQMNQDPNLRLSPDHMAEIITSVSMNRVEFSGFSPEVNNTLRGSYEAHMLAEGLVKAAQLPYINELFRRNGESQISAIDMLGYQPKLATYGIDMLPPTSALKKVSKGELRNRMREARLLVEKAYFQHIHDLAPYLNIGLTVSSIQKRTASGRPIPLHFDLYDQAGRLDEDSVYWMFATFLRERAVRDQVELLSLQGVPALKTLAQRNRIIQIVSAYPEVIPIFESLPLLDFNPGVNFAAPEMPLETSYAPMKGLPGVLVSFYLQKQIVGQEAGPNVEYIEAAGFSLVPENPLEMGWHPFPMSPEIVAHFFVHHWTEFSNLYPERTRHMRVDPVGDETMLDFQFELAPGAVEPLKVLADFYLFFTEAEKRDGAGRLFQRTPALPSGDTQISPAD